MLFNLKEINIGRRIIKWILQHIITNVTLFVILNFAFLFSLDPYMSKFFPGCILWYNYNSDLNNCTWRNYIPFSNFITIFTGEKENNCFFSPNLFFFQSMYLLLFGLLILRITLRSKNKVKVILLMLGISLVVRCVYSFLYLYKFKDEYNYPETTFSPETFNIYAFTLRYTSLSPVFFHHFPNLILGILGGYIYYLDCNYENILTDKKKDLYTQYEGIDNLRSFISHYITRNILFLLSIASIVLIGLYNDNILRYIKNIESMFNMLVFYAVHNMLISFLVSIIYLSLILTVKLKGEGILKINQIIINLLKKFLSSQLLLLWGRSIFIINILGIIVSYYIVLSLDIADMKTLTDFFNIIVLNGLPVIILIFVISMVLTILIEVPLRIFVKNKLGKRI